MSSRRRSRKASPIATRIAGLCAVIAVIAASLVPGHPEAAGEHLTGKWTTPNPARWDSFSTNGKLSNGGSTHMVLLRGNGDSTWILHWHDYEYGQPTTAVGARLTLISAMSDSLYSNWPVPENVRLFCAGHALLKDGRAMVVGGTTATESGLAKATFFDPGRYGESSHGWVAQSDLVYGRWYPTATTLGDGRVLATSGLRNVNMVSFGGLGPSGTSRDSLHVLNLLSTPAWNKDPIVSPRPPARWGHTAVFDALHGRHIIFGGNPSATATDTLSDVWSLVRTDTDDGVRWAWTQLLVKQDPVYHSPAGRSRHSASIMGDTMIVFGGLTKVGGTDVALNDVWRLFLGETPPRWEKLAVSGTPPSARYGHTGVVVPGQNVALKWPQPRVIVFGGRDAGAFAAATPWALSLPRQRPQVDSLTSPPQAAWTQLTEATGGPTVREGHTAVLDENRTSGCLEKFRSMIVFGGQDASGQVNNDAWILSRPDSTEADTLWSWMTFPLANSTRPAARTRHTAIHDVEWDRMLVFGGDTNGSGTTGGGTQDMWAVSLNMWPGSICDLPVWTQVTSDSVPGWRVGQTALFDPRDVFALIPERFTATGSPQWKSMPTAHKREEIYPHTFLHRSGKVFFAGNQGDTKSAVLDSTTLAWAGTSNSGFYGGSSAQYSPDSVLKCGGYTDTDANTNSSTCYLPPTVPAWATLQTATNLRQSRSYHNVTVLPTGDVLVSGGHFPGDSISPGPAYRRRPELWSWNAGHGRREWGADTLSSDPANRGYHSTTLLLPDGRILAAGTNDPWPTSELRPTIFWPPYLFAAADTLAARPIILSAPDSIVYDAPFSIGTTSTSTVSKVVLIRPGSVTHAFNESQRYDTLTFTRQGDFLTVNAPPCGTSDPPGDYLLFLVDNKSGAGPPGAVPSRGKWVRLQFVPPAVNDLAVDVIGPTSMTLVGTAPGDNCHGGQAVKYDLRHAIYPLTELNFYSGAHDSTNAPHRPGLNDQATVGGLQGCLRYYFALKSRIEPNTWSAISNVADQYKPCGGFGPIAGSSGGGGWTPGNSVLNPAAAAGSWTDRYRLSAPATGLETSYGVRLVESAAEATAIDSIALVAVDHSLGQEAFARNGNVILATRQPAYRVTTTDGTNIAPQLIGEGGGYVGRPSETLLVRLEQAGSPSDRVPAVLQVSSGGSANSPDSVGLLAQVPGATPGSWATRARIYPRIGFDDFLVDSLPTDSIRLVFLGRQALRYVGRLASISVAQGQHLTPLTARHSRLGDVLAAIGTSGGPTAVVGSGDTLDVTFAAPLIAAGLARDRFLVVRGAAVALPASPLSQRRAEEPTLPRVFALSQNQPNPFGQTTRIGFELPQRVRVRLEIFDLQGRRVRVLADGVYPPGHWSVAWDRRDGGGGVARSGVYFYGIQAGSFHSHKKMVLLP